MTTDMPCPACLDSAGLCVFHAKSVLPQLAQPFWYQLVGTDYQKKDSKTSPEAQRIIDRKARKRAKRIQRLLAGEFAPARAIAA